jgi:hypothetical protein
MTNFKSPLAKKSDRGILISISLIVVKIV